MSSKNTAEVILGGKVIKLGGYESEEYLQRVASYINNKITEFNKDEGYRLSLIHISEPTRRELSRMPSSA